MLCLSIAITLLFITKITKTLMGRYFYPGLPMLNAYWMLAVSLLLLSGCAAPSLSTWGEHYHWQYVSINSTPIPVKALISKQVQTHSSNPLHVYIEGDGEPFLNALTVSPDPTPHDPLMLRLMAKDTATSIFLTRPCYFLHESVKESLQATGQQMAYASGQAQMCSSSLWTLARYSPIVVQSLASAIEKLAHQHDKVVLIGHSGGGTLAALLVPHLPKVTHLITLSGNLDIDRWTAHHALTPLSASLNPMTEAPLPARVRQIHYVGEQDKNILPQWARAYARRQPDAQVIELKAFDHQCCWEEYWPALLAQALTPATTVAPPALLSPP